MAGTVGGLAVGVALVLAAQVALTQALFHAQTQTLGAQSVSLGGAAAQEQKKKPRKTRRTPALRNSVYEKMAKVQEFIEEKRLDDALEALRDMEEASGKRALNSYELANLHNMYAFVYYTMGDYAKAQQAYRDVIAQPNIPLALEINTRYTIAQLYFVREQYRKGIDALYEWFEMADNPGAQAYALLAQGYYQLKDNKKALENTLVAINMFREKGKVPREQWLNLARYLYFEKDDVPNTLALLEELAAHYPRKDYWVQLSHMYAETKQEKKQLAAMETAYVQDMLTKDLEQVTMAQLYLNAEVPYKAAKVLHRGIEDGSVEDTSKTLEVLGISWRQAQEVKRSIPVMAKAADKSDKGELYCQLGNVYLDNEQFEEAIEANKEGLRRGGVKRPDTCHLVLGMAYFNNNQFDSARKAFDKAAEDERSEKYALQWIKYMDNEIERQRRLREEV